MRLLLVLLLLSLFPSMVHAEFSQRYVTLVNPVRGRVFWKDIDSVERQIKTIIDKNLPATWLLQYSVLTDEKALNLFINFPPDQEVGVFLEIDEELATDSLVPYLLGEGDWARADKVLLSGYFPWERKRLIDTLFNKFKAIFGSYPKSVGSWYIDTFSLNYLVDKYHIKAVLDVADQYQTDGYGVWGKPWGTPYYPSKLNSLLPAQTGENKLEVVKIQWAQRDPVLGYGFTVSDSTFSVQANDYLGHHRLNTDYFEKVAGAYLFSPNPLTQLTLGLEVGQEGAKYLEELKKQLVVLTKWNKAKELSFTSMSDFAKKFKEAFPALSPSFFILDHPPSQAFWFSTPFYRVGFLLKSGEVRLHDLRLYKESFIFSDIADRDRSHTLKRIIPSCIDELLNKNSKELINNLKSLEVKRRNEKVEVVLTNNNGEKKTILLKKEGIFFAEKEIFQISAKISPQEKISLFLTKVIVNEIIGRPHNFFGGWRFSYLNGQYYFGLMWSPNKLLGFSSTFPFLGVYHFPFQTLVRFKSLPRISPANFLTKYLETATVGCTIRL